MFVKNVQSILVATSVIVNICKAFDEHATSQDYFDDFEYDWKKPSFQKKIYTAEIDGISFELHYPIVLDNCSSIDPFFQLDFSESSYLPISHKVISSRSANNCTLMFPKIFIKRKEREEGPFAGFIKVKAIYKNRILDVTSIILLPIPSTKDMKFIFDIDGIEYIIINYFYLKIIFVGLTVTILLLLVVEIRDMYEKINANKYKQLENQTNI